MASQSAPDRPDDDLAARLSRRQFIRRAVHGTAIVAFGGGLYALADDLTAHAQAATRTDGRPRLPPGQRVLRQLKPMGGQAGDPKRGRWQIRVTGEVEQPLVLGFRDLLKLPQASLASDVHCVTGWSVLGARFEGVRFRELLARAKPKPLARYAVIEAAHGYTANVRLRDLLMPNVLLAHSLQGSPLSRAHGAPVRAVVPDLYFWKSAKWITGLRLTTREELGYWEQRGYHRRGDPWLEQRYA